MGTLAVLGVAAAAFTVTNVDAFVVLAVLFATSRSTGVPRPGQILAGQYLGFAARVAVAVLAASGLRLVPDRWVGLLGPLTIAAFFVLLAGWCAAAALIGSHKRVAATVGAAGRWLIPAVFNAVGAWVLLRSGALANLATRR
ncbi:cadmium resistance transporter [Pseudonocardia acidicola]|uniref:DUF4149 domain-containing protein n=1 Tax=Pseudonocardia acidicola TaxID=2724939 RepID=A0ABX1SI72_9PSEU|nr:cadmium resistance transporter [Pseudonocardia acidicola]NMH99964.1 hypothetical protein [Pseudonocardia acidicola]